MPNPNKTHILFYCCGQTPATEPKAEHYLSYIPGTQEFDDLAACQNALAAMKTVNVNFEGTCIPKGS